MVEHQRRDARLGVHHVPFGEVDADFLGAQGLEELALEGEVRAGGVAEAVALAAVAGGELVLQGEVLRVGEAPALAEAGVEILGGGLGGLQGQGGEGVALQVLALDRWGSSALLAQAH